MSAIQSDQSPLPLQDSSTGTSASSSGSSCCGSSVAKESSDPHATARNKEASKEGTGNCSGSTVSACGSQRAEAPAGHDHGAGESGCCGSGASDFRTESLDQDSRTFRVTGLCCVEEVSLLRREVGPLVASEDDLAFDVLNSRMFVKDKGPSNDQIVKAVARTGLQATFWQEGQDDDKEGDQLRRNQLYLTIASGLFTVLGFALHVWSAGGWSSALSQLSGHGGVAVPWYELAAYSLAVLTGGRYVAVKAWYAAKRLRPDINLLMIVAVIGAFIIGDYMEGATVAFLFSLSLTLEAWSVGRARRAIASLMDLAPAQVRLKRPNGQEEEVPVAEALVGATFVVKPGERIPLDGLVTAGFSAVNQAPITGESQPQAKEPGETVYAGTINGDGALEVAVTRVVADTTLARIIRQVEQAQSRRAKSEQWVDRFALIYTPAVMVLALLVFLLPPLVLGADWTSWFYNALVLLVIACPCALVISTPVSIVAALASAARQGVLIKGGSFLELPARLTALAFDKTGTLTLGRPRVTEIVPLNGHSEDELLARAAALEARSPHPLAQAILAKAQARQVTTLTARDVQVLPGKGVSGTIDGRTYWLGSHRYLLERGQDTAELQDQAKALQASGNTVVVIGNDSHVCGVIGLADAPRPEAPAALAALRRSGVDKLVMLTGDNQATAQAIAQEVGLTDVRAELLPEDKVSVIEDLAGTPTAKGANPVVAMVGDGVNDAPAMARANFGIAMGAIGTDAAIETADIALMTDDLSKLAWLVTHSKRAMTIIKQNIAFALAVKLVFVGLTLAGLATLWAAIAADVGGSLLVVFNALRLLRSKEAA
ncbi:heavy metal translocating P-type ATPase [Rhodovibrionaceae bacterium A322]